MLALLHITSGNYVKFQTLSYNLPIVDLELMYKSTFYSQKINHTFLAWLEKIQAKIITGGIDNKITFYKNNPFLKNVDVFMADFEVVVLPDTLSGPNMDIDISKLKVVQK